MAYRATEKTRAKQADPRQRILAESHKLVRNQGFAALAVSQVADNAGIATGSMYRHFSSKSELVAEVFRYCTRRELQAVADAAATAGTAAERLQRAVICFCQRAIRGRRLAYALIAEPVDPLVEKERLAYRHAYAEIFAGLIAEGVAQQQFVAQVPAISASAIVGMLAEVLLAPLAQGDVASVAANVAENGGSGLSDEGYIENLVRAVERLVGVHGTSAA